MLRSIVTEIVPAVAWLPELSTAATSMTLVPGAVTGTVVVYGPAPPVLGTVVVTPLRT